MSNIGLTFKGEDWADIFQDIRKAMHDEGKVVDSRIGKTIELIAPTIVLTNPRRRLFYNEHRTFNLIYALVEAFYLFNNNNEVKYFSFFNKRMSDYSDDGIHINSAYGYHIADKLQELVNKLKESDETRQAVLTIYNTKYGLEMQTKDVPCTIALHFLIRDGKLDLITYMRSNDLFWGLQYDLFMFTCLQEVIANELGIEMGNYIHCPSSLHVYEYHWELLDKINAENTISFGEFNFNYKLEQAKQVSEKIMDLPRKTFDAVINLDFGKFISQIGAKTSNMLYYYITPLSLVQMDGLIRNNISTPDLEEYKKVLKDTDIYNYVKRWYNE